jgi:hypothetical protein
MKILVRRCFVGFFFLGIASLAFAGPFKSRIIRGSPLEITVTEDQFLRVWNFTQVGGADRGAVAVTIDSHTTNVLTASRIDTVSSGSLSQDSPDIVNQVVIAGPAEVAIAPVLGATLFITFRKETNEGTNTSAVVTPSPVVTPTATPAPTATPTPTPFGG